ncbi:hypothetical protein P691DRAFT_762050 [Macrolepiota fuliginosa MF-IS2]|uniref:Uncharacterized protein n=1 Tax=Macrolepiota fuliginosa MF-IS2 TaxID=1400762 RepID=A0A9P5X924_9AGAR|nr:hypothetical protein P691DRAFT_762050 [Macrolepiota fuliginosa MF-IS2]
MIIDKTLFPNDSPLSEAPPAYETVDSAPPTAARYDLKPPVASGSSVPASASGRSTSPSLSSYPPARSPISPSVDSGKGKGRAQWFNFGGSKTSKDVKSTTLGLVRDLVRQEFHPAAVGILESCAEACSSNGISFSSLLQEKSIEGHTPLYWAIVKRKPDEAQDDSAQIPDLLTVLLSYSTPLSQKTISDIQYACLITSDQPLFQRLRQSPDFASSSALDEMLIGATLPPDDVEVINLPDDEGSFTVNLGIVKFQKRMMITKSISIEFIARSRMWRLRFFVVPEDGTPKSGTRQGSWCLSLSLMEHSPPTWVDSRLMISDPVLVDGKTTPSSSNRQPKPKPTISMRLKSTQPLSPSRANNSVTDVTIAFEDSLMATSLQYNGSSYIAADETLRAQFEARLGKPDTECIIC